MATQDQPGGRLPPLGARLGWSYQSLEARADWWELGPWREGMSVGGWNHGDMGPWLEVPFEAEMRSRALASPLCHPPVSSGCGATTG